MKPNLLNRFFSSYADHSGIVTFRGHSFYGRALDQNSICLDLGANLGEFSSQVTRDFECVCYAIEMVPTLYQQIKESTLLRKFNYAINDNSAPVQIYLSKNPEANSIHQQSANFWDIEGTMTVDGTTLEAFLNGNAIKSIDLLKVDIEGAEIELFGSVSDETLSCVKQITVEFHDFIAGFEQAEQIKKVKARLKSLGFFCITFSRPYNNNNVLFVNKKNNETTKIDWARLYALEYFILRLRGAKASIVSTLGNTAKWKK